MARIQSRASAPGPLQPLLAALAEEERNLLEIVRITQEFRRLLAINRTDELEARVRDYERTTNQARALTAQREPLQQEMFERFDLKGDSVTLRDLAARVGGEQGRQLTEICERLRSHGDEIARANRHNSAIVVLSADLSKEVIQALTHTKPGGDSYGAGGERQDALNGSMIELNG
jgi:hypothetical protein